MYKRQVYDNDNDIRCNYLISRQSSGPQLLVLCAYCILMCVILFQQARELKADVERKCTPVFNSVMVKKTHAIHDDDNRR